MFKKIDFKSQLKIIIIKKNIIVKINNNKNFLLIEKLKISLEAIDVIYINKINIPPKKIKNKE